MVIPYLIVGFAFEAVAMFVVPRVFASGLLLRSVVWPSHFGLLTAPGGGREMVPHFVGMCRTVEFATGLHMLLQAFLRRVRRNADGKRIGFLAPLRGADLAFLAVAAAFLLVTIATQVQGDYRAYLTEWTAILQGHSPWDLQAEDYNAYGPLFVALAPIILVSPLAPKLLFSSFYLAATASLLLDMAAPRERAHTRLPIVALLIGNLYPWQQYAVWGQNDALLLALVLLAAALISRAPRLAAGAIAGGLLFKLIPIVFVPFLALRHRRIDWPFITTFAALVAAGLAIAVMLWGTTALDFVGFAMGRASMTSPLELLDGRLSDSSLNHPTAVIVIRGLLIVGGLGTFGLYIWRRGVHPALFMVVANLTIMLFYQVGYAQYYATAFGLAALVIVQSPSDPRSRAAAWILVALYNFLGLYGGAWWWIAGHLLSNSLIVPLIAIRLTLTLLAIVTLLRVDLDRDQAPQ